MGAIERRARRFPPVRGLMTINDAYNAAGGGLLASGLAFSALFAVIPGMLLVISVLILVRPTRRPSALHRLDRDAGAAARRAWPRRSSTASRTPRGWAPSSASSASCGAPAASTWRSRAPSAGSSPRRADATPSWAGCAASSPWRSWSSGVLAAFATSAGISFVVTILDIHADGLLTILSPVIAVVAAWLVCLACYRLVPVGPPHWRAALVPAIVAGTSIGLLTSLFGALAPVLVRDSLASALASVFLALVWFGWLFQAVLLGAAYARLRDVQDGIGKPRCPRIF